MIMQLSIQLKTYTMNATVITKTLKKVEQQPLEYSLGFRRLEALPSRVRFNFGLASNLNNNWDGAKAHEEQLNFLENLTEQEFVNWMKIN